MKALLRDASSHLSGDSDKSSQNSKRQHHHPAPPLPKRELPRGEPFTLPYEYTNEMADMYAILSSCANVSRDPLF